MNLCLQYFEDELTPPPKKKKNARRKEKTMFYWTYGLVNMKKHRISQPKQSWMSTVHVPHGRFPEIWNFRHCSMAFQWAFSPTERCWMAGTFRDHSVFLNKKNTKNFQIWFHGRGMTKLCIIWFVHYKQIV